MRLALPAAFLSLALTGCALTSTSSPSAEAGVAIQGMVHGGQQPIAGAHVYLMAANTTGYGNASVSLLTALTGFSDSVGYYVPTAANGSFSITADYACTANTQVYVYVLGGNPGAGTNSAAGLMAILGNCPATGTFAAQTPYVWVNEVSTVAAAYAMAGFAADATHVSSSGTALAKTGIAAAFANAANLASLTTGVALTTTPAGNGTVPQTTIDTLANILAACVNSTGPTSTICSTLFANAESAGSSGTLATDTATAAINIAHNPGVNVAALYAIPAPSAAFAPALSAKPNDFTLALSFTGGGLQYPESIAIDASGNAWTANGNGSVSSFSSLGAALSPAAGYTGGGLVVPYSIAIDSSGNAWVASIANGGPGGSLAKFSNAGAALSPAAGYTGGGLNDPLAVAIDGTGNVWLANNYVNSVSKFSSAGVALTSTAYTGGGLSNALSVAIDGAGSAWFADDQSLADVTKFSSTGAGSEFTGGGLGYSQGVALDSFGNAWVANPSNISKISNSGTAASSSAGYTGGGLNSAAAIALDGSGSPWIANRQGGSVSRFSSSGAAISPSTGYTGPGTIATPGSIAIDGSGNVWTTSGNPANSLSELIGAAVPVITPLCAGLPSTAVAGGASNLATRP